MLGWQYFRKEWKRYISSYDLYGDRIVDQRVTEIFFEKKIIETRVTPVFVES